ncbi:hypothetical protein [Bacillus sp. 2211]|uniref:hypothetical protein n=2 Tax=Bacillaceae TaxID=186817 RepID=UPI001CB7397F|nr:hypothetical protein [Bacillus sp. 2211]
MRTKSIQEVIAMQEEINRYKPGPVKKWKMTPEQLAAYIEKHPIIYREELKPSAGVTMRLPS